MNGKGIGPYVLEEPIGGGGSSVVWKARETARDGRANFVAVKFLRGLQAIPEWERRFKAEVEMLQRVSQHPRLVTVLRSGVDDALGPWIAFELMKGDVRLLRQSNGAWLPSPVPSEVVFRIVYQVAEGLRALHERTNPIVHGDIKPSNILFLEDRRGLQFKLTDFGGAFELESTRTRNLETSHRYVAPEVVDGVLGKVSATSDLYSLGMTALELLLGEKRLREQLPEIWDSDEIDAKSIEKPTRWQHWHTQLQKHIRPLSEIAPEVAPDFSGIVDLLVRKKANERVPTSVELLERLRGCAMAGQVLPKSTVEDRVLVLEQEQESWAQEKHQLSQEIDRLHGKARTSKRALVVLGLAFATSVVTATWVVLRSDLVAFASGVEGALQKRVDALEVTDKSSSRIHQDLVDQVGRHGKDIEDRRKIDEELRAEIQKKQGKLTKEQLDAISVVGELRAKVESILIPKVTAPRHGDHRVLDLGGGTTMEFVYIDAPSQAPDGYTMGSPETESGRFPDERQHHVVLKEGFWLGATEVTVAQFRCFVTETQYVTDAEKGTGYTMVKDKSVEGGWKEMKGVSWKLPFEGIAAREQDPVSMVSWNDAVAYCAWLSKSCSVVAKLPSEEQWEFSCRAGTKSAWSFGVDPTTAITHANVVDKSADLWVTQYTSSTEGFEGSESFDDRFGTFAPCGSFLPNSWGLFDMHGNVWEWCHDSVRLGSEHSANGVSVRLVENDATGPLRVVRGGSWSHSLANCRSARRRAYSPGGARASIGFRVLLSPSSTSK